MSTRRNMTSRQVAQMLGIAVSTAQTWLENGVIPSWRTPGGHRRCALDDVNAYLQKIQKPPSSTAASCRTVQGEFLPRLAPNYPVAADESERLAALNATRLVDSAADESFDRIAWLAAQATRSSIALISLLTADRQWFKSRIGLLATSTARELAFCSHTVLSNEGMVVCDALEDPRFKHNDLVLGEPYIRFYAGMPIYDADKICIGTLCVLHSEPRTPTPEEIHMLRELAHVVSDKIALLRGAQADSPLAAGGSLRRPA